MERDTLTLLPLYPSRIVGARNSAAGEPPHYPPSFIAFSKHLTLWWEETLAPFWEERARGHRGRLLTTNIALEGPPETSGDFSGLPSHHSSASRGPQWLLFHLWWQHAGKDTAAPIGGGVGVCECLAQWFTMAGDPSALPTEAASSVWLVAEVVSWRLSEMMSGCSREENMFVRQVEIKARVANSWGIKGAFKFISDELRDWIWSNRFYKTKQVLSG